MYGIFGAKTESGCCGRSPRHVFSELCVDLRTVVVGNDPDVIHSTNTNT